MQLYQIQEARALAGINWKPMMKKGTYATEAEKHGGKCPTCHRDGWRQFPETHSGTFPVLSVFFSETVNNWYVLLDPKPIKVRLGPRLEGTKPALVRIESIVSGGDQPVREWNRRPHTYDNWGNYKAPNFRKDDYSPHGFKTLEDVVGYHMKRQELAARKVDL